jgi:hypothetical protein
MSRQKRDKLLRAFAAASNRLLAAWSSDADPGTIDWDGIVNEIGMAHDQYEEFVRKALEPRPDYDGPYYNPGLDNERLDNQLADVFWLMAEGDWLTDVQIAAATGHDVQSCGAQRRHLRKPRHGSWVVEPRPHAGRTNLREYQLRNYDGSSIQEHGFIIFQQAEVETPIMQRVDISQPPGAIDL